MANVAWAIEAVVRDDQGRPQDRFAQWGARDASSGRVQDVPRSGVQVIRTWQRAVA